MARFLDVVEAHPRRAVRWASGEEPWSFRVTLLDGMWLMDDIEAETEGMEEFFKDDDLTSRDGVAHVILSVLVPLAMEIALENAAESAVDHFLADMEGSFPVLDDLPTAG